MASRSRSLQAACAVLLAAAVPAFAQAAPEARVIVKFKPGAKVLEKAALAGANGIARSRADVLAKRMGLALDAGHEVAERMQVLRAQGLSSEALAQALAADADVEFAVPDRRRRVLYEGAGMARPA